RTRGKTVELDPDMLTRLASARIDDFSLVYGVTFDDSNASGGWVGWDSDGYRPNGDSALQVPYLRALIDKLHALGIRVTVGYNVRGSTVGQKLVGWLDKADDGQIRKHTEALNHWFEKKHKLDIDGIGFDFEFTELKERHRDKIAKLFQGTAAA